MGYGDEIMALGRAEKIYRIIGTPVAIVGVSKKVRHHPVWQNNPAVDPNSKVHMVDGPSARPYIIRWVHPGPTSLFNSKYHAVAGKMKLTAEEWKAADALTPPGPFVIVEPVVRGRSSKNKVWGSEKWEEVIRNFPVPVYQFDVDGHTDIIPSAKKIASADFRVSAGVVSHADLIMTTDGGMHHLAASMNTPAVVIFGGFADPSITGYPYQVNFYVDLDESPCGRYGKCPHCEKAMNMIKAVDVRDAAIRVLKAEGGIGCLE